MHRKLLFRWVATVFAVTFGALTASCGQNSDEPSSGSAPPGHALVDLYGYPFLIPHAYFWGQGRSGSQTELALIASLPGVGPDGKSAAAEWAQGSPRLLMIGTFPPTLYTKMGEGKLYPEQVVENLINLFHRNQHSYVSFPQDIEFKRDWSAFVQSNTQRENQVLDATRFLAWDSIGTPPEKSYKTALVVISGGRIIMFGGCGTQRPDRSSYHPNCTSYFQEPGDVFALQLTYDAERKENSLIIARQLVKQLRNFNKAAITHLGHGKLAFANE